MITKFKIKRAKRIRATQKGALLLELLIVISLVAITLSFAANGVFLSLRSNKASGERDVANSLAAEALEAVRATTEEDWQNIYSLTKSSQHYQATQSGTKWVLTTGDETVPLNGINYIRYFIVENTCRSDTTRDITGVTSCSGGSSDDPSTQKVTATVSWSTGVSVVISEYFFRWRNKVCNQTEWVTALPGNTIARTCPYTNYDSDDGNIDHTDPGKLKLK